MLRNVEHRRPEPLAAMVPATSEIIIASGLFIAFRERRRRAQARASATPA
jgi:hypothetical protein